MSLKRTLRAAAIAGFTVLGVTATAQAGCNYALQFPQGSEAQATRVMNSIGSIVAAASKMKGCGQLTRYIKSQYPNAQIKTFKSKSYYGRPGAPRTNPWHGGQNKNNPGGVAFYVKEWRGAMRGTAYTDGARKTSGGTVNAENSRKVRAFPFTMQ